MNKIAFHTWKKSVLNNDKHNVAIRKNFQGVMWTTKWKKTSVWKIMEFRGILWLLIDYFWKQNMKECEAFLSIKTIIAYGKKSSL